VLREQEYDGLYDWFERFDAEEQPLLSAQKKPMVQAGELRRLVTRVLDCLLGDGNAATIEAFTGPTSDRSTWSDTSDAAKKVQAALDGMGYPARLVLPTLDLLVGGSFALAFSRPSLERPERLRFVRLQPEWCEVVFASGAKGARGRAYAAHMQAIGVPVEEDEDGPHFAVPEEYDDEDVVFLRYQYRTCERVPADDGSPQAGTDRWFWIREDHTPTAFVTYKPVETHEHSTVLPKQFEARPFVPHEWGRVPVVWGRERTAEHGDLDGAALLSDSAMSLAKRIDYSLSFAIGGSDRNADPDVVKVDLVDAGKIAEQEVGAPRAAVLPSRFQSQATGGREFSMESIGQHQGKAFLLESSGKPMEESRETVRLVRQVIADNTGVIRHDPERASGAQSGEAMRRMMQPLIQLVGGYATTIGDALDRLVRLIAHVFAHDNVITDADAAQIRSEVSWPDVVPLTATDAQAWAQVGSTLAGYYPVETAVALVARQLGEKDPSKVASQAVADAEERMQRAKEAALARTRDRSPGGTEGGDTPEG
jgi:hypothetical protein